MKLLIGLLALCGIFLFSSLNWQRSVKAALFILVIEGALRKWVLPQANELIYFLKDFILLGAYLNYYFLQERQKKYINNEYINFLIIIVTCWCLFQSFNPSLGSPIIGILGLKGYLLNIPLIWMLQDLFQSEQEMQVFLRKHLLLIIPVGILGIVQFFSPPSSPINSYAIQDVEYIATFGSGSVFARITGSFSYLDTYVVYLIVCFGLLIPLLVLKQSGGWKWASFVEILLVSINSFMTGSRSCVFASILFLVGYFSIQGLTQPASNLRFLKQFLLPVLIIVIAASIWFRPAIEAFWFRTTSSSDSLVSRISRTFTQPLEYIQYKGIYGYGTGATQTSGRAISKALGLPVGEVIPIGYEEEPGRIMLELGLIGFIFWYGLRVSILILLWLIFWKLKRPFLRKLALTAFLIHAIQLNDQLVTQHVFSVYYWFLASFIFLLPRLEKIENLHKYQQLLQQNVSAAYFNDSSHQ